MFEYTFEKLNIFMISYKKLKFLFKIWVDLALKEMFLFCFWIKKHRWLDCASAKDSGLCSSQDRLFEDHYLFLFKFK